MKKLIILTESRRMYEVMCKTFTQANDGRHVACYGNITIALDSGETVEASTTVASFSNVASAYWEESAKEVED